MKDRWKGIKSLNVAIDHLIHRDGFPDEAKEDATSWAINIIMNAQEEIREENQ